MLMTAKQGYEHITVNIKKGIKNKVKKKIIDYNGLMLKECVEAGLILILDKDEKAIRNILKKYYNMEVKA